MEILFGKLVEKKATSADGNFHLYRLRRHGGDFFNAVYVGQDAPKALKSVELQLNGKWVKHPKFGNQFQISKWARSNVRSFSESQQKRLLAEAEKRIGALPMPELQHEGIDAIPQAGSYMTENSAPSLSTHDQARRIFQLAEKAALECFDVDEDERTLYLELVGTLILEQLGIIHGSEWLKEYTTASVCEIKHLEGHQ